jgi:hypothetical protein
MFTGAPFEPTEYRAMNPGGKAILRASSYRRNRCCCSNRRSRDASDCEHLDLAMVKVALERSWPLLSRKERDGTGQRNPVAQTGKPPPTRENGTRPGATARGARPVGVRQVRSRSTSSAVHRE